MKLYGILFALLAFAGLGLWGQQQHLHAVKADGMVKALSTRAEAAEGAVRTLAQDARSKDAINLAKQQQINKLTQQAAQTQQALNEALKNNRAWADAPVPDGVWDAIDSHPDGEAEARSRVDGTRPDPAKARQ